MYDNPYAPQAVASSSVDARAAFITKVYVHLFGAIVAFVLVESALVMSGAAEAFTIMLTGFRFGWIFIMILFVGASWMADRVAHTARSKAAQYAALGIFVVVEAIVFMPMIWICTVVPSLEGVIESAGLVTALAFAGLTLIAHRSRRSFSFLGPIVQFGFLCAMIAMVASFIFGFSLGIWFSGLMVLLAGAMILYNTRKIMHEYPEDRYIGAALGLFSGVALMFWYVLRIFMATRN